MSELDRGTNGKLAPTRSNLRELIDRYVPRYTQEEVWEMAARNEERVFDLLSTLHEYRERCEQMAKRMDEMEREAFKKYAPPVSIGRIESSLELQPMDFSRRYLIRWSPDQYRATLVLSDMITEEKQPYLCAAVVRQFEEHLKAELIPQLRREFEKLFIRHP